MGGSFIQTCRMPALLVLLVQLLGLPVSTGADDLQASPSEDPQPFFLFADGTDIKRIDLDTTGYSYVTQSLEDVQALDYDYSTGDVYWINHASAKIQRLRMFDSKAEVEDFIVDGLAAPEGVSVDWINEKLYWTDKVLKKIECVFLNGSRRSTVISSGISQPKSLAIDPLNGWVFWTDIGRASSSGLWAGSSIERARLSDFSERAAIVSNDLRKPSALTVDYLEKMLYWVDTDLNSVERCDMDGLRRLTIVQNNDNQRILNNPISLTLLNDRIYWTEYSSRQISHCLKDSGKEVISIAGPFIQPSALKVFHQMRQPTDLFCSSGHHKLGVSCYEVNVQEKTWNQSAEYCQKHGGHIVSINTKEENTFISSIYKNTQDFWLGASGCQATHWQDGSRITYIPRSHLSSGHNNSCCLAAELSSGSEEEQWGFTRCSEKKPFICEYKAGNMCIRNSGRGPCSHGCSSQGCHCPSGFRLQNDGKTCQDINECSVRNGGCSHHCLNTVGSYRCTCIMGYTLAEDNTTCIDANECNKNNGGCAFRCVNTPSSHYCTCPTGYELKDDKRGCQDIDECENEAPCSGPCLNTPGSYKCSCIAGFIYNASTNGCQDINECKTSAATCQQRCINSWGSYRCACSPGYRLQTDGKKCTDIDECQSNHTCQQQCINTQGSYTCKCQPGYRLAADGVSCHKMACSPPTPLPGFTVRCTESKTRYSEHDTCFLVCLQGHIYGANTMICGENGQWQIPLAECIADHVTNNTSPIAIHVSSNMVPENSARGTVIGWLRTVDLDPGQTFTYDLMNLNNLFTIEGEGSTSRLVVAGVLDYEMSPMYILNITSIDSGKPPKTIYQLMPIYIGDLNEPPSPPQLTGNGVDENVPAGTVIGQLWSHDPDVNQSHSYILLISGNDQFEIRGNNLLVKGKLDYESRFRYDISIQVTDSGAPSMNSARVYSIYVRDMNDPPTAIELSNNKIQEYTGENDYAIKNGTIIGFLSTVDEDGSDSHKYQIINELETEIDCFLIDSDNALRVGNTKCFDYEMNSSIKVLIETMDKGGLTFRDSKEIIIVDVNEPPYWITLSSQSVLENAPVDSIVGSIEVLDPEKYDVHECKLLAGMGKFKITGNLLRVATKLSAQQSPAVEVTIEAKDTANQTYYQTLNIFIKNVNEPPQDLRLNIYEQFQCRDDPAVVCVPESSPDGVVVAVVMATDPDGDELTFDLYDVTDTFHLQGQMLTLVKKLNYESGLTGYGIGITVRDPSDADLHRTFAVKVLNVNDPPSKVLLSNSVVPQNARPGDVIGQLSCIDEDSSDVHTYQLGDSAGGVFTVSGANLKVASDLRADSYRLVITCSDGQASSPASTWVFYIQRETDSKMVISLSPSTVEENNRPNTTIGNILLGGAEENSYFNLSLDDTNESIFQLMPSLLPNAAALVVTVSLDFETQPVYYLNVKASNGSLVLYKTLAIQVTDVLETATDLVLSGSSVAEDIAGATVGSLTVVHTNLNMNFDLYCDQEDSFQIVRSTGGFSELKTKRPLDYETTSSISVIITAVAPNTTISAFSKTFNISILNVNEAPVSIIISQSEVRENSEPGTTIGTFIVTDPDSPSVLQRFSCVLLDNAAGSLDIHNGTVLVVGNEGLDYEDPRFPSGHLSFEVECADQGQLSVKQRLRLQILNVNEPPTDIFSENGKFEVKENQPSGEVVAYLRAVDPDQGDDFHYSLLLNSYQQIPLAIVGNHLVSHTTVDYETSHLYDILIKACDKGGLCVIKNITVTVVDTNDAPSQIVLPPGVSVDERAEMNSLVGSLIAIDEDAKQTHSFSIKSQYPNGALRLANGSNLVVANGNAINYENNKEVVVTISCQDSGKPPLMYIEVLRIPVNDKNEAPRGIALSKTNVDENANNGTIVASISVDDPDTFPQNFFCVLQDDANGTFSVSKQHQTGQNQLKVANSHMLDFERNRSHSIALNCSDNGGLHAYETFTIDVQNTNDVPSNILFVDAKSHSTLTPQPPNSSLLTKYTVSTTMVTVNETLQDSTRLGSDIVAYVYVLDEDNLNRDYQPQIHSCRLISEAEYHSSQHMRGKRDLRERRAVRSEGYSNSVPTEFQIGTVHGTAWNSILVSRALDYEKQSSYLLYIKCSDNGIPKPKSIITSLHVRVLDLPEAPFDMDLAPLTVNENSHVDTLVGEIEIHDQDGPYTVYGMTLETRGTPFYLKNHSLYIMHNNINYETTPLISVQIKVQEIDTELQFTKLFHVRVRNVNEPPCCVLLDGATEKTLFENLPVGGAIGRLSWQDEDVGDTHTIELVQGNAGIDSDGEYFSLSGRQLLLARKLYAYERDFLRLVVRVRDQGNLQAQQIIYIRVQISNCGGQVCHKEAFCDHRNNQARCRCRLGFSGNGMQCTDTNDCAPYPCDPQNALGCTDGYGGLRNFSCSCKPGWAAPDCRVPTNHCDKNHCSAFGTLKCVSGAEDYSCVCKQGFRGARCEVNVDACSPNPCLNGGQCLDSIRGYSCRCKQGYAGVNCDTDLKSCIGVGCPNQGVCIPTKSAKLGFVCRCQEPYSSDCLGCSYGYGGPFCTPCNDSYTGENCELNTAVCAPNPCYNNGQCIPHKEQGFLCLCEREWDGVLCNESRSVLFHKGPVLDQLELVPIVLGVLTAILLLTILILLLVWTIRRKFRNQITKATNENAVRYDSSSDTVEMDGGATDDRPSGFTNPVYDTLTEVNSIQAPAMTESSSRISPAIPTISVLHNNWQNECREKSVNTIQGHKFGDDAASAGKRGLQVKLPSAMGPPFKNNVHATTADIDHVNNGVVLKVPRSQRDLNLYRYDSIAWDGESLSDKKSFDKTLPSPLRRQNVGVHKKTKETSKNGKESKEAFNSGRRNEPSSSNNNNNFSPPRSPLRATAVGKGLDDVIRSISGNRWSLSDHLDTTKSTEYLTHPDSLEDNFITEV